MAIRRLPLTLALGVIAGLGAPAVAWAGPIEDAADSLERGEWLEIETGLDVELLVEGSHHILQYTDDARWDQGNGAVLFAGAGHEVGTGRFLRYDEAGDAWTELQNNPSNWVGHAYDHSAFDTERGLFFHRVHSSRTVHAYDTSTSTWGTLPPIDESAVEVNSCCNALEYFPEMNSIVYFDGAWGIAALDLDTDSWTGLGQPEMGNIHNFAEYSPQQEAILFGGGNGSSALYRLDADGTITGLADAPIPALRIAVQVITIDPNTGVLLVFDEDASYEYDPETDSWLSFEAAPFIDIGDEGAFGAAAAPIDSYGVVFFMKYTHGGGRTWVYRHSPGKGPPPGTGSDDGGSSSDGMGESTADGTGSGEAGTASEGSASGTNSDSGPTASSSASGPSGESGGGGGDGGDGDGEDTGCSCRSTPVGGPGLLLIALGLGAFSRRRRAPT